MNLFSLGYWRSNQELDRGWGVHTSMADVLAKADDWLHDSPMARSPVLALWKPRGVISTMAPKEPNNLKQFLESLTSFEWPAGRPLQL